MLQKKQDTLKKYRVNNIRLFGSYAKNTFKEDSDIDIFCLGELNEDDLIKIKAIGKTYGKTINIKTATIQSFENGLRKKDVLITEILKYHLILQNPDTFVNALWRHYHDTRE